MFLYHTTIIYIEVWLLCYYRPGCTWVQIRNYLGVSDYRPNSYHPTNKANMMLLMPFIYTVNIIVCFALLVDNEEEQVFA